MPPIEQLPSNLPGQESASDKAIAAKVRELVTAANVGMEVDEAQADAINQIGVNLAEVEDTVAGLAEKGTALAGAVAEIERRLSAVESASDVLPVTSVVLTPNPISVRKGQTAAPIIALATADGTPVPPQDRVVVWGSNKPSVASVDEWGVITGLAAGSASVTATVEGVQAQTAVSVTEVVTPPPTAWVAVLPQKTVPLDYVPATGASRSVATDNELRAAIAASADGDEIVVKAPITGNGLYEISKKITIRAVNLPTPGKRVTPASGLVSVKATNPVPVFQAVKGGSLRLVGLDIGAAASLVNTYTLVAFGKGDETALSDLPTNCVLDRCVVVGHPALDAKRAVGLQSVGGGVVDSWLSVYSLNDAAAVWGWNGPGPYTVVNTRLEASGENWMFGGSDARIANTIPSDILIDRCHIIKDYSRGQPKNFGEAKNGRRIHQTRCVIEGVGVQKSTQPGYATTLSATDQDRMAPWSTVQDVTISWCEYRNVKAFLNVTGWVFDAERFWTKRVSVQDCLIRDLGDPDVGIIIQQHTENVECVRTTFEKAGYVFVFEARTKLDGGIKGVRLLDNAGACMVPYQLSDPLTTFDLYAPGREISGNVWSGYAEAPPTTGGVSRTQLASKLAGVVV